MAKNKAQLLKDARAAGVEGLTTESTVKEIRAELAKAGDVPKPAKTKAKQTPDQLQEARLARSRANRDANVKEQHEGAAEAERLEREALASRRTGPQQALDRRAEEA